MLNLSDYDPNQKPGAPRRYFNYEGIFGRIIRKDGFGLHGQGTLSTNAPQSKIELMGEIPLPLLITIPLGLIPIVGRAARTFYRPTVYVRNNHHFSGNRNRKPVTDFSDNLLKIEDARLDKNF